MADEPNAPDESEVNEVDDAATSSQETETSVGTVDEATSVEAQTPEFSSLQETLQRNGSGSMDRFYDVQVPVWAELGRVELPLGDLIQLSEGSVLRLDRPTSEPVDLVSQGVKLARGEVIVIDDCFAVRIKELVASK